MYIRAREKTDGNDRIYSVLVIEITVTRRPMSFLMKGKSLIPTSGTAEKRNEQGESHSHPASGGRGDFGREFRYSRCRAVQQTEPPCTLHAITWRYTSSTQSRDALRVQPRLRGESRRSLYNSKFSLSLSQSLPIAFSLLSLSILISCTAPSTLLAITSLRLPP